MTGFPWRRLIWLGWAAMSCQQGGSAAQVPEGEALDLLYRQPLEVKEPSGLALDPERKTLWAVGNNRDVCELDLRGAVLSRFKDIGEDLEGIAFSPVDSTLWVADEADNSLIQLSRSGQRLARHRLALRSEFNKGLEGICLDARGRIYALNEKNPGLFLALAPDLGIERQLPLAFAGDYSDLACDAQGGNFWVLSDQDQALFLWHPEEGVLRTFPLPFANPEGVAVDAAAQRLYLVSDEEGTLYVFGLPDLGAVPP
jgi:uncharacterized protein YjiK